MDTTDKESATPKGASDEPEQDLAHVMPPFAAPAVRYSANAALLTELRRWAGEDPGYAAMLIKAAVKEIEWLDEVLASRCRVQGGNTSVASPAEASPAAPEKAVPEVLFDGKAVYDEVMANDPHTPRPTADNIADVLDAVVRLIRKDAGAVSPVPAQAERGDRADAIAMFKRDMHNIKRQIEDYCQTATVEQPRTSVPGELEMLREVISTVRQYPDFDGDTPFGKMMDEALEGKRPELLNTLDCLANGVAPHVARQPAAATAENGALKGMLEVIEVHCVDLVDVAQVLRDGTCLMATADEFDKAAAELRAAVAALPVARQPQAGQVADRKAAEYAYTISAFDYTRNPVGSRDWTLFWSGYQASVAAHTLGSTPQASRDVLEEAKQGIEAMLLHFTSTPSRLADSIARGRGHKAIGAINRILASAQAAPEAPVAARGDDLNRPSHETIVREGDSLVCTACGTSADAASDDVRDAVPDDEALRDAVIEGLRGLYGCGRVWSAWGVGTMTENDFYPADESEEAVEQVVDAIRALRTTSTPTEGASNA